MTCQEFVENKLCDFVDDELDHSDRQQSVAHLDHCVNCTNFLKNFRATEKALKQVAKKGGLDYVPPPGFGEKLRKTYQDYLQKSREEKQQDGQPERETKSMTVPRTKTQPRAHVADREYFKTCPRDNTGHCLPKGNTGQHHVKAPKIGGNQLSRLGGTGQPAGGNTFTHARNVIRDFQKQVDGIKDKKYVAGVVKAVKFLRGLTRKFTDSVNTRYGKAGGLTILATGQALGWSSFVVSTAAGYPLYIPGSTILGSLPAVVLAECILKLKKELTGSTKSMELSPSEADRIWREFQDQITDAYQKWLEENSEIVDDLAEHFHGSNDPVEEINEDENKDEKKN